MGCKDKTSQWHLNGFPDGSKCPCVQDISSVTLCEENIMFWKVSGIGSEVIGLFWNLSVLEYSTGLFILGLFLSLLVHLLSSPLGHSCV